MAVWGDWYYTSGNGARLGYDAWYSGNVLNLVWYIQTRYNYSNDTYTVSWSGTFSGSVSGTLNSGHQGVTQVWSGSYAQGYNTTASITVGISGLYDGSSPTVNMSFTLSPLAPNAPTSASDTYVNDSQINVSWTNNPTSERPIDVNNVFRIDNVAGNSQVAQLGGGITSYSDTGLVANRRFSHHIYAANSAGSAGVATNSVYTTPAAPANVQAAKTAGSDIQVTWDASPCTYYTECTVGIEESTNGGTSWTNLGVYPTASSGSWTHSAPSTSVTHTYRVRVIAPSGLPGPWTTSNTVQLLARPNAPTNQVMTAQIQSTTLNAGDATGTITTSWKHNPVDSSAQSAYEIGYQVSTDGGSTWAAEVLTGKIASAVQSRTWAANTWLNNRTLRWRVRTWGLYAGTAPTESDWSAYSTFYTNARPVASLSGPNTWVTSVLTATGGYLDPEASTQTGARWTLKDGAGNILEEASVGSSEASKLTSYTFTTRVNDGTSYGLVYAVRDGAGFWSAYATKTINVVYAKPEQPALVVAYSDANGAVTGQIANPQSVTPFVNVCPNPSFEVNTTGWEATGGSTLTRVTTWAAVGTASGQFTPVAQWSTSRFTVPVVAGQVLTVLWTDTFSTVYPVQVSIQWRNSGGSVLSASGNTYVPTVNTPAERRYSYTAPAGTASAFVNIGQATSTTYGTVRIDKVLVVADATAYTGPYFDGSSTGVGVYSWTGTAHLSTSRLDPAPATSYNVVYRDGVPLLNLSNIPVNGTFVDPIPPLNKTVTYTVQAVSSAPSSSLPSTAQSVFTTSNRVWLNGGLGMAVAVSLLWEPALSGEQARERKWVGYDTRADEVLYTGVRRERQYQLSALVTAAELNALLALEDLPQPMCYRDPSGRRDFVGVSGGIGYSDGTDHSKVKQVSFTLRSCGYSE